MGEGQKGGREALRAFVESMLEGADLDPVVRDDAVRDSLEHLEEAVDAAVADGLSEQEAIRVALERFGAPKEIRRRLGAVSRARPLRATRPRSPSLGDRATDALRDTAVSVRNILRRPLVPAVVVLTVSIGVAAVTSVFAVVESVLFADLPYPEPDELVALRGTPGDPTGGFTVTSPPNYLDLREGVTAFTALAAHAPTTITLVGSGQTVRLDAQLVSASFFTALGVPPRLGRTLTPSDEEPGSNVMVISHDLWRGPFGGATDVVGRLVTVDGVSTEIVGVMPAGFRFENRADVWIPLELVPGTESRGSNYLSVFGRLAPGQSLEAARSELSAVGARLHEQFPEFFGEEGIGLVPLRDHTVSSVAAQLRLLAAAAVLVLLIVCANVANLTIARTDARTGELWVRSSIGASRRSLIRLLCSETAMLTLAGGILGVLSAGWLVRRLVAAAPEELPRIGEVGIDAGSVAVGVLAAALVGIMAALAASWRATRGDESIPVIRAATGVGQRVATRRIRSGVVVAQVAGCLVLTINATLLVRSLIALRSVDPGIETAGLLTMQIDLGGPEFATVEARSDFLQVVADRLEGVPGVREAAIGTFRPTTNGFTRRFALADRPAPPDDAYFFATFDPVGAGYFSTMGIPTLRGRDIGEVDVRDAAAVAVVNDAFVREYYQEGDPIGQRLGFYVSGQPRPDQLEIVGVVGDVRSDALDAEARPAIYVPLSIAAFSAATFYLRTSGDPTAVVPGVREALVEVAPTQPVYSVLPMSTVFDTSIVSDRFVTLLLSSFATVAMMLALTGVFGLTAFAVGRRTREFGLRIALGAAPGGLVRQTIREGLRTVWIGLVLGIFGAVGTARLLEGSLYGVTPLDPGTYAMVVAGLVGTSVVAVLMPARRAATVDPLDALRAD